MAEDIALPEEEKEESEAEACKSEQQLDAHVGVEFEEILGCPCCCVSDRHLPFPGRPPADRHTLSLFPLTGATIIPSGGIQSQN